MTLNELLLIQDNLIRSLHKIAKNQNCAADEKNLKIFQFFMTYVAVQKGNLVSNLKLKIGQKIVIKLLRKIFLKRFLSVA